MSKIEKAFQQIIQQRRAGERKRGTQKETLMAQTLEDLQNQGRIISYWHADSYQDLFKGIDFVIMDLQGTEINLQVKSSPKDAKTAKLHYPEIPCIVVSVKDDPAILKDKLKSLIGI